MVKLKFKVGDIVMANVFTVENCINKKVFSGKCRIHTVENTRMYPFICEILQVWLGKNWHHANPMAFKEDELSPYLSPIAILQDIL